MWLRGCGCGFGGEYFCGDGVPVVVGGWQLVVEDRPSFGRDPPGAAVVVADVSPVFYVPRVVVVLSVVVDAQPDDGEGVGFAAVLVGDGVVVRPGWAR